MILGQLSNDLHFGKTSNFAKFGEVVVKPFKNQSFVTFHWTVFKLRIPRNHIKPPPGAKQEIFSVNDKQKALSGDVFHPSFIEGDEAKGK